MIDEDLVELVKSIKNRCIIFLNIYNLPLCTTVDVVDSTCLCTLLEDLYTDAQTIIHDYCKEEDAHS